MTKERKRPRTSGTRDFLDTPMYRLVDRHRAILEKIRTREDAEYWGTHAHRGILSGNPELARRLREARGSGRPHRLHGFLLHMGVLRPPHGGEDPRGGPDGTR